MKIYGIILLAALAGITVGCSNPVYVQTDESANLAKYKTYAWVETRASQDDNKNLTAFAERDIHRAVTAELSKKGWVEVTENPDVLVSYDILVERTTQQQSSPVYSQPFSRVYYNPYLRRWGTVYYPSQFVGYDTYNVPAREGTVTITILDPQTDKTVWQAWTTETMDNMKLTSDELTKAVRKIFKKFDTNR
jgi:hypothetical protein